GRNEVTAEIHDGKLYYSLRRDGRALLLPSLLGFELRGAPPLHDGLHLIDTTRQAIDEMWTQPCGVVARVRDHCNELKVSVAETAHTGYQLRPLLHSYPRGEPRRLRADDPALTAHGRSHLARRPLALGRRDQGARAHAVRDAVAHHPARRAGDGSGPVRARPEPESAQRAAEHRLDQADEVRRHLVGHAHRHDDVELGAQARGDDRERETLHR